LGLAVVLWAPQWLGAELAAYRNLLLPGLLAVPALSLHGFLVNVLAAARHTRASGLLLLVIAALSLLAVVLGVLLGGVPGYYWALLVAYYTAAGGALVYLHRRLHLPVLGRGPGVRTTLAANPGIVPFALIIFAASYTQSLSLFVTRYAVLSHHGEAATGLLQAAIGLAASINLLLNPANGLYLTPYLNRAGPVIEKMRTTLEFERKLLVVMAAAAMPLVLFAPWLLILLYSAQFVAVGAVLFVFVLAQCLVQLAGVHQALLIGLDELRAYGAVVAAGQLTLGLVAWLAVPAFGLAGAAAGFLGAGLALFCFTWALLHVRHGFRLPARLKALIVYSLLAIGAGGWLAAGLDLTQWSVIAGLGLFYVLFAGGLLLFLTREELGQLGGWLDRMLLRGLRPKGAGAP
jgi:O-antigen/teichoic acid export membrane protein